MYTLYVKPNQIDMGCYSSVRHPTRNNAQVLVQNDIAANVLILPGMMQKLLTL